MAMSAGDHDDDALVEINVTPMVDVLLSLLIIFMISQPTPVSEKVPLTIPKNEIVQQPNDPKATLMITVEKGGVARIGKDSLPADFDKLVNALRDNEKAQLDQKIVVNGNDDAKYADVIRVMAAASEAGIAQVGVASKRL